MKVNEHIVLNKPASVVGQRTRKAESVWVRRAVLRSIWRMRERIIVEHGIDIFQVYDMTDCVEVHIEGDFVGLPVAEKKVKYLAGVKRRREARKKREDE